MDNPCNHRAKTDIKYQFAKLYYLIINKVSILSSFNNLFPTHTPHTLYVYESRIMQWDLRRLLVIAFVFVAGTLRLDICDSN